MSIRGGSCCAASGRAARKADKSFSGEYKRLRVREIQVARLGSLCPPEIIIEVEELRSNISQIEDKILQKNTNPLLNPPDTSEKIETKQSNQLAIVKSLIQEKFEEILKDLEGIGNLQTASSSENDDNSTETGDKQDIFNIVTTPKKFARNAQSIIEYITKQLGYSYQEIPSDHISCSLSKNILQNNHLLEVNIRADFETEENFGVLTMDIPADIIQEKDISFIHSLILRINSILRVGSFAVDLISEQITFRSITPTGYVDMEFVSLTVTGFEQVNVSLFPFIEKYTDRKIIHYLVAND